MRMDRFGPSAVMTQERQQETLCLPLSSLCGTTSYRSVEQVSP